MLLVLYLFYSYFAYIWLMIVTANPIGLTGRFATGESLVQIISVIRKNVCAEMNGTVSKEEFPQQ